MIVIRSIYLFVGLAIVGIRVIEARVYCQDSNARPWMPLGITCPVVCANIRNAIDGLMLSDYKNTISDQFGARQKINKKELDEADNLDGIFLKHRYHKILRTKYDFTFNKTAKIETEYDKELLKKKFETNTKDKNLETNDKITFRPIKNLNQYTAILKKIQNVKGILRRSSNENDSKIKIINKMPGKCWYIEEFIKISLLVRIGYRPCTRKSSFDLKFVQIMTNILNKYADSLFKFTVEMTEILLESIFGTNTDLRNNILDVNKLLKYLRKSVDLHNNHSHGNVITLESKRCHTLYMPGCFCKPGYVESEGQCVHPSDCVPKEYNQYLARIIVL